MLKGTPLPSGGHNYQY